MKIIFALVMVLFTISAQASFTKVADREEASLLKKSAVIGIFDFFGRDNSCATASNGGNFGRSVAEMIDTSDVVMKSTDGQPLLRFVQFFDTQNRRYIEITSDGSRRVIQSLQWHDAYKLPDEIENQGTLMRPKFVTVPGVWKAKPQYSCNVK
ncbi:MAG: hypothetical protein EOP06_15230 [Proteobacteria bacterium]|nr:MAG: hypothetical protein EOP06_15230 [Pseudomonadota bacterium]